MKQWIFAAVLVAATAAYASPATRSGGPADPAGSWTDGSTQAGSALNVTPNSSRSRRRSVSLPPLREFEGNVTAVSSASITVHDVTSLDVTATIIPSTVIRKGHLLVGASAIPVGSHVHLRTTPGTGDTLVAAEINAQSIESEAEIRGTAKIVAASSLVVTTSEGDINVNVDGQTLIRKSGHNIALADVLTDDIVEVKGIRLDPTTIQALSIHVEDDTPGEGEGETDIHGVISSIGTTQFVVSTDAGDVSVNVDTATVITRHGTAIAFADLAVGDHVEVEGTSTADGILAAHVGVERGDGEDGGGDHLAEISGPVASVGTASFAVTTSAGPVTVHVSDETMIVRHGSLISLADVSVGDNVEVGGISTDASNINALVVHVETEHTGGGGEGEEHEIRGVVMAVSADAIEVQTLSGRIHVHITAATEIRKGDNAISLADITVGDGVEVSGTDGGSGVLEATVIHVEAEDDGGDGGGDDGGHHGGGGSEQTEVHGSVSSVGADSLVVGTVTIHVTADTHIIRSSHAISLGDIHAGDQVEVAGVANSDGSINALLIHVEGSGGGPGDGGHGTEVSGSISNKGADGFDLSHEGHTVRVTVNGDTTYSRGGDVISFADLSNGDHVEVSGVSSDSNHIAATHISVETED